MCLVGHGVEQEIELIHGTQQLPFSPCSTDDGSPNSVSCERNKFRLIIKGQSVLYGAFSTGNSLTVLGKKCLRKFCKYKLFKYEN